MWTIWQLQQQRGAQVGAGSGPAGGEPAGGRQPGEAPREAVSEREAQKHGYADLDTSIDHQPRAGIEYPAEHIAASEQDNTPTATDPDVEWDEIVQPERRAQDGSDGGSENGADRGAGRDGPPARSVERP